jgi:hypothetical protein
VEKDGSYRTTLRIHDRSRHGADGSIAIQERAQVGNTEQPYPSLIGWLAYEGVQDSLQGRSVDGSAQELRAFPLVSQGMLPQFMYRP